MADTNKTIFTIGKEIPVDNAEFFDKLKFVKFSKLWYIDSIVY